MPRMPQARKQPERSGKRAFRGLGRRVLRQAPNLSIQFGFLASAWPFSTFLGLRPEWPPWSSTLEMTSNSRARGPISRGRLACCPEGLWLEPCFSARRWICEMLFFQNCTGTPSGILPKHWLPIGIFGSCSRFGRAEQFLFQTLPSWLYSGGQSVLATSGFSGGVGLSFCHRRLG